MLSSSAADPHHFYVYPKPDPVFFMSRTKIKCCGSGPGRTCPEPFRLAVNRMILSGNPDPDDPFFLSNLFNFSGQIWRVISPTGYIILFKNAY